MGIEPTYPVWKTGVLADVLHLHKYVSIVLCSFFITLIAQTLYRSVFSLLHHGFLPDRNRTYITPKVGLRCHSLSTTPRPFCYQRFQPTYLPFTSPHYNRARQQDPRVRVVPESVKLLIGVHYKCNPSLARASSFATGRGSPYCFWCRPTSAYSLSDAQAAFSVVRNEGHSQLSLGSLFHSKAFQSTLITT